MCRLFHKKLSSVCFFPDLFASSVKSLIPPAPSSMLCRRCGLCSRITRKKNNIVLKERVGGNVHDLGQDSTRTTAHYDNSQELLYTSKDVVFLPSDATSGRTVVYRD